MALALVKQAGAGAVPSAPMYVDRVQVTFDSSYPTGGEDFDPSAVLGDGRTLVAVADVTDVAGAKVVHWDRVNAKLQVLTEALVEVANASDQSGVIVELALISQ